MAGDESSTAMPPVAIRRRGAPKRRDVTLPTTVIDLRPAVAGFDNALAWLARVRGLRTLSAPIARWSRRLVVHVHQIHSQTFAPDTIDEHQMLRLWVSNGTPQDAHDVRFHTRWHSESPLFNARTEEGLWLGGGNRTHGQEQGRVSAETDLLARGYMQYVGLVVKYLDDHHAYLVTPENHRRFANERTSWRWPSQEIAPGLHRVDVAFRSREGGAALLRLTIMNPGRGANLSAQLTAGQLVN